jgi:phosphate:Na+ symporter
VPIILGQNIGTCVTGLIASAGSTRAAKRVAFSHLYYNIIGSALAIAVVYTIRAFGGFSFWNHTMNMGDVANFHTIFNILTTLFFLPFSRLLIRLTEWTAPDKPAVRHPELDPIVLDPHLYTSPAVAIAQAHTAVGKMLEVSRLVCENAPALLFTNDAAGITLAMQRENWVDQMDVSVTNYLVGLTHMELSEQEAREVTNLLQFVSGFERIGDYAINIVERAGEVADKHIVFSDMARQEMQVLHNAVLDVLDQTAEAFTHNDLDKARLVEPLEETVDEICQTLHTRHIERLKSGQCSIEGGIIFLEAITNYERISDHCSSVAARLISEDAAEHTDPHTLLRGLHAGREPAYNRQLKWYKEKYRLPNIML